MAGRMLYLRALSPIHSGIGQSTGVIDLPVAREKITDWPYLPGSSLKGVLRDACDVDATNYDAKQPAALYRIFGPKTDNASDRAGALTVCDAHLLCLPIRSFYGTFAWITCPLALSRWKEDAHTAGAALTDTLPDPPASGHIVLANQQTLTGNGPTVYLEDLDLPTDNDGERRDLAREVGTAIAKAVFDDQTWRTTFIERFGIVDDDTFTSLTLIGTEVAARIVLYDESKTVKNLWYEEAVPAQAIFASPLLVEDRLLKESKAHGPAIDDPWAIIRPHLDIPRQIGGSASVGRGLTSLRLPSNGSKGEQR